MDKLLPQLYTVPREANSLVIVLSIMELFKVHTLEGKGQVTSRRQSSFGVIHCY